MKPILLVGGGGHCHSCIDVIEVEGAFSIQGIVEQSGESPVQVLGYPVGVGNPRSGKEPGRPNDPARTTGELGC
jgi:hypothetical protein